VVGGTITSDKGGDSRGYRSSEKKRIPSLLKKTGPEIPGNFHGEGHTGEEEVGSRQGPLKERKNPIGERRVRWEMREGIRGDFLTAQRKRKTLLSSI